MAEQPFLSDDPRDWAQEELPAGHPSNMLRGLRDQIPENKQSGFSLLNMGRDALGTMANWMQGNPQTKDMIGPTGGAGLAAAGMTRAAPNTLSAFIGPAQVKRLGLSPGSRGSLDALERAQASWDKGGMSPEAIAETWAKEGWAPPESFGVKGGPFSWLEAPDLAISDRIWKQHAEAFDNGEKAVSEIPLTSMLQPGRDLDRLLQSTPGLTKADMKLESGPGVGFNGSASLSDKQQRAIKRGVIPATRSMEMPPWMHFSGKAEDPEMAAQVMIGHELRGHGVPKHGGVQSTTYDDLMQAVSPRYDTAADEMLLKELVAAEKAYRETKDPMLKMILDTKTAQLTELRKEAAASAGYFNRPEEKMARHADLLSQQEGLGRNPFTPEMAPGIMSTWRDEALGGRGNFRKLFGGNYSMKDLEPGTGSGQSPPFISPW